MAQVRLKSAAKSIAPRATATARHKARHYFGEADAGFGIQSPSTRRVITHRKPDGDAIVSAWLAERFLLEGASVELLFVDRRRVFGAYRPGDCLVDVGNINEPANHFFDHKPPAFPCRHDSCAAKLIWEH